MIEGVTIAGAPFDLAHVLADVTIRHGRGAWGEAPNASSATITLYDVPPALPESVAVGHPLVLSTGNGAARFTGTVTDAGMSFPVYRRGATITLTAIGNLAALGRRYAGATDYPAEPASDRATRIAADAGASAFTVAIPASNDYQVAARPAKPETALAMLSALATTIGGVLYDLPDGSVLLQSLHSRPLAVPVDIPAASVLYAPSWEQAWDVENRVRVKWSGGEVVEDDPASIATWGEREASIETDLASEAVARLRGLDRLIRLASPKWQLPEVVTTAAPDTLPVSLGGLVRLAPDQSAALPLPAAPMVVEGWTDAQRGDEWQTTIHLSGATLSFVGLTWADIPADDPAYTWATINQTTSWAKALSLSDL